MESQVQIASSHHPYLRMYRNLIIIIVVLIIAIIIISITVAVL